MFVSRLFDIGGQRVDRRKWATMYDGLNAILYCIAISEYDQKYEDEDQKSKLADSLDLLEQTCKCDKFAETPIFVFLNEVDVLKEKLDKIPLKNYIPEYSGKTEKDAMDFLMNKVKERTTAHASNLTFFEYMCAIDTDATAKSLDNVFKKLISIAK
uniref:G-protein alpha subunit n=1 Tax=Panagrellus redivivus TaxID=6233 RepID=A0A7E4VGK1_PANRE